MATFDPLPDGDYLCLVTYVTEGSDFTLDEALSRLRAAFPGRVVRANPLRRNRRLLAPWGGREMVGLFVEVNPGQNTGDASRRACEVLSGFKGAWATDVGQGNAVLRQTQDPPEENPQDCP